MNSEDLWNLKGAVFLYGQRGVEGSFLLEELYQAFAERFAREHFAYDDTLHNIHEIHRYAEDEQPIVRKEEQE